MNARIETEKPFAATAPSPPSPGDLLKQHREENDWTIGEIASALHLSSTQIEAIEANDYDNLPGKTYVLGYWKSYASLMGLDISASVEHASTQLDENRRNITLDEGLQMMPGQSDRARRRFSFILVLLSIALFTGLWYWQNNEAIPVRLTDFGTADNSVLTTPTDSIAASSPLQKGKQTALPIPSFTEIDKSSTSDTVAATEETVYSEPDPTASASASAATAIIGATDPTPVTGITQTQQAVTDQSINEQPDNAYFGNESPESNNTSQAGLAESEAISVEQEAGLTVAKVADSSTQNDTNIAIETKLAAPEKTEAKKAEIKKSEPKKPDNKKNGLSKNLDKPVKKVKTSPPKKKKPARKAASVNDMKIVVSKQGWLDIRDSTGKRVVYRTVNPGEKLNITGQPPFSVFVGNANGIEVTYLDKKVEYSVHKSGVFSRFAVGSN